MTTAESISNFFVVAEGGLVFAVLTIFIYHAFKYESSVLFILSGGLAAILGLEWRHWMPGNVGLSTSLCFIVLWVAMWAKSFKLLFAGSPIWQRRRE